ncbi:glycosyltransferase [Flavivirga sp. 57AJ16]|uniref:glycosyltransferase n=1 Tax=Flavivirga sp. 57AJ16 TaxID=3025307 RepID=UPI002365E82E|nr:glycosyltransferase [Flavivirga sp. 57AJ16]MDD7885339.1 glycosyltransferase [Flavivirga sp. 57AJ16]
MKILLIGEYSRLHNSLKEGLIKNGHKVVLVGSGDGFKNYPVDINIGSQILNNKLLLFITKSINKISGINLIHLEIALRFYAILHKLKEFDIVQLINENSIKTNPTLEIWLLKKLINQNKKLFLLSCGTDYTSVKYAFDKKLRYSILTPLHNNSTLKKHYKPILKYITKPFFKLHTFLFENIEGVISSDLDYHIPLKNHPKYLGLIPNPVNTEQLNNTIINSLNKINIFHGINSMNYIKKGNVFFEDALAIIQKKYPNKINITSIENTPYNDYIKSYNNAHIFLDQVYAYDQGYNALEAMAKGKVVFTGAEKEWLEYYNLEENSIAINALPNADKIAEKLEWLILNPEKIIEISKNARNFIEKEHNHSKIATKYLNTWKVGL